MKIKLLLFYILFQPFVLFAQNKTISKTIFVDNNFSKKDISNNLYYFIDYNQTFQIQNYTKIKNWQIYNNSEILNQYNKRKSNFKLWLNSTIQNTSNDTLNLVIIFDNFRFSEILIKTNENIELKKAGYLVPNNQKNFSINSNSFAIQFLPNQQKQIFFNTYIDYITEKVIEVKIQTQESFNSSFLKKLKKHNYIFSVFGILTGGILIMLFYNLLLFFQYKEKNYLYYSFHLFFTFFNYSIVADGLNQDFFGNINQYRDLMLESTYVLSFIFYTFFVFSVLSENTKKKTKKLFVFYIVFMLLYLISVVFVFLLKNNNLISNFIYQALFFRIISSFFGIYIIYVLLKTHKNSYLKYIMYGTLIFIISYLTHVIFNLFFGNSILNHFFNLIGTLIEILFFTYALNLRKKLAEHERDILIKLNKMKSRFFANISHEFRTPLTLIKSPVQSLQSEITIESQKNKLNLIDKNSSRMLELVDQLLELSKLDSGKLQLILKQGNIAVFLNSLVESFAFQAKENNITFIVTIEKNTENHYFDTDVIEKIATNLLSNALKYTTNNENIWLNSKIENNQLQLVVSNSGSEIKKEELSKLFERFYQKNVSSYGVGIGLALVKELVELYKGTIKTTIENKILSFIVALPLEKVNENAILVPNIVQKENVFVKKIETETELPILLIVDDNNDVRTVLKDIFATQYQIIEAEDGEKGLKIAKKEIPDCIISDVMMPKMDGFEFAKQIKNNELTSFIPIVLLTAKTSEEAHLESLKSTADAFLTKPFNNQIVKETVNQLIAERKKLHERYSQELVLKPVDIVINSLDEKFIEKLQIVLNNELANSEFSSEDFASAIGMSRMQLHRKLKTLLGVSATEFLRNERLKIASKLLKEGNGNISDVAYAIGFNDVSYFSKCFKEMYQCTPTEFIEK